MVIDLSDCAKATGRAASVNAVINMYDLVMPLLISGLFLCTCDCTTSTNHFAMQTFFGSVKKCNASTPPSRPTPLAFMPPKGTRRSRTNQQFTQTVPV